MKKLLSIVLAAGLMVSKTDLATAQKVAASSTSVSMSNSTSTSLPLFYNSLVPFNNKEHAKLTLPKQAWSYKFASATDVIPLLVSEVPHAVRHYPIIFIKDKATSVVTLVALVGRGDGKNIFVDVEGKWRAGVYVPAWVRRYPFALVAAPQGEGMLAIDAKAELLAEKSDGQLLVGTDGKPTEALQKIVEFQKEFHALSQLTERVMQALVQSDILEEAGLSIRNLDTEKPVNVQGFMVVNERKLKALKSEQVEQLFRADALGLAYAQLISMGNFPQVMSGFPRSLP